LTDLEQWYSSSQYLDESAADSAQLDQSQPSADTCVVDTERRQAEDVAADMSQSKRDKHANEPLESATHLPTIDMSRMTYDPDCRECRLSFKNVTPDQLTMYLHAYSYQVRFFDDTTTTTVLRPFLQHYPGEPVPEETSTHPPS